MSIKWRHAPKRHRKMPFPIGRAQNMLLCNYGTRPLRPSSASSSWSLVISPYLIHVPLGPGICLSAPPALFSGTLISLLPSFPKMKKTAPISQRLLIRVMKNRFLFLLPRQIEHCSQQSEKHRTPALREPVLWGNSHSGPALLKRGAAWVF